MLGAPMARARCVTPPRITEHKPPRPRDPLPPRAPSSSLSSSSASAASLPPLPPRISGSPAATPTTPRGAGAAAATSSLATSPASPDTAQGGGGGGGPPVHHAGHLAKLGDAGRLSLGGLGLGKPAYKRRYFVLDAGVLSYYESEAAHALGKAAIKGNRLEARTFTIAPPGDDPDGADIVLAPLPGSGGATSGAAGGGGGSGERVWKFRGDGRADVEAWRRALVAHGVVVGVAGVGGGGARAGLSR